MSALATLGAALLGDTGPKDDASYGGEVSASPFSMDYARTKLSEFQQMLNALDMSYQAAQAMLYYEIDEDSWNALVALCTDYENKRYMLKSTAEALNAGAAVINYAGGRMPSLSLPGTLGAVPLVPVAFIAAITAAASLIVWGNTVIRGINERMRNAQLVGSVPESDRAAVAQAIVASDQAVRLAEANSGLGSLAGYLKVGLGVAGVVGVILLLNRMKDDD